MSGKSAKLSKKGKKKIGAKVDTYKGTVTQKKIETKVIAQAEAETTAYFSGLNKIAEETLREFKETAKSKPDLTAEAIEKLKKLAEEKLKEDREKILKAKEEVFEEFKNSPDGKQLSEAQLRMVNHRLKKIKENSLRHFDQLARQHIGRITRELSRVQAMAAESKTSAQAPLVAKREKGWSQEQIGFAKHAISGRADQLSQRQEIQAKLQTALNSEAKNLLAKSEIRYNLVKQFGLKALLEGIKDPREIEKLHGPEYARLKQINETMRENEFWIKRDEDAVKRWRADLYNARKKRV